MARARWTGDGDREVPVEVDDGSGGTRVEQVDFPRLEWVDVPAKVLGKRPSGSPGGDDFDPGSGLLSQGEWNGSSFCPYFELESVKKAAKTRALNEED